VALSQASKNELKRRQREQMQLAEANIEKLTAALASSNILETPYRHRKLIVEKGKEKLGPWLTVDELREHIIGLLEQTTEHLRRWSVPYNFETPQEMTIPKPLARAMNRLRKRTRQMLRKQSKA
jgi:hypothetical protein